MDDDWDLHAVVKGCSAAGTSARASAAAAAVNTSADQNPFPSFSSINFHDEESLFDFHGIIDHDGNDPFQGLQEIYQELCGGPPPSAAVIPAAAQVLQAHDHQEIMQIQPSLHQMNVQLKNPILGSSSNSFPVMDSQPTRPGRRKNQQTKIVHQMTQDELSADSWAWRKYGQKPIKGSPYPRNYYRCSTSKGCAARKQVERSPTDPGIFIVSYSGEHTHPRPSHRSSLSGSTRTKFSTNRHNNMNNNTLNLLQKDSNISSSSPSGSSFSPPLMEGEATAQNHRVAVVKEDIDGGGDEDDDENNVMNISNDHLVNDDGDFDMFKGFQDSDDHESSGGGGDFFSGGLLSSPPWTPTSSAVNGGGCV